MLSILDFAERVTKGLIFLVGKTPLSLAVFEADDATYWIIRAHTMGDGVAEYPAKKANRAGGGGFAATDASQSPLFSAFRVAGRLPPGDVVHEIVDVTCRDGGRP